MTKDKQIKVRLFNQPFAKAFPEVQDVVVEYEVSSRDIAGASTAHGQFTMGVLEGTFQGQIPCRHPQCHGGGFEIEHVLDTMVQEREESREGVLVCPGWLGDCDRVPCVNSITYNIEVFYKVKTTPGAPLE